jgi:hypothetical protein
VQFPKSEALRKNAREGVDLAHARLDVGNVGLSLAVELKHLEALLGAVAVGGVLVTVLAQVDAVVGVVGVGAVCGGVVVVLTVCKNAQRKSKVRRRKKSRRNQRGNEKHTEDSDS